MTNRILNTLNCSHQKVGRAKIIKRNYMKYLIIIFIVLLKTISSYSQNDTLFLFFEKDNYTITNAHLFEDRIKRTLKGYEEKINVSIYGYTDIDGKEGYNMKLAKNRIKSAENILTNYPNLSISTIIPHGEKGKRLTTKLKNRRVEIIFHIPEKQVSHTISSSLQSNIDTIIPPKKEKIYKDSLISFPSGMKASLDKTLVATLDTTNDFSYFNIIDASIYSASHNTTGNTQDIYGNPLASAGMFTVVVKDKEGRDACLDTPITIRLSVREDGCYQPRDMLSWERDKKGGWRRTNTFKMKVVEINGKKYFEAKVICPGRFNIDAKLSVFKMKLKVKTPIASSNYILTSVILSNKCKTVRLEGVAKKNNVIKIKNSCNYRSLDAQYYFQHKGSSKIYVSDKIPLYKHKKKLEYGFCKVEKNGQLKNKYILPKRRRLVTKVRNFTELRETVKQIK